jgi:hypothetical protein
MEKNEGGGEGSREDQGLTLLQKGIEAINTFFGNLPATSGLPLT